MPVSECRNMDCMEVLGTYPDKFFDLAIVDPPYGISIGKAKFGQNLKRGHRRAYLDGKKWDDKAPSPAYFLELFRVSKNQIIWGGNYFHLPPTKCFIVWDKGLSMRGRSFADCEMAWTSFDSVARIFSYNPTHGGKQTKIHPTQKPVALYRWLLERYAKAGDRILDTHLGSGSSRIAAYKMGFDFWGFEIDADYFKRSVDRFKDEIAEPLFVDTHDFPPSREVLANSLF